MIYPPPHSYLINKDKVEKLCEERKKERVNLQTLKMLGSFMAIALPIIFIFFSISLTALSYEWWAEILK